MGQWRSILADATRFLRLDAQAKALAIEATFAVSLAALALRFVPFPRLAARLGVFTSPQEARALIARRAVGDLEAGLAAQVGWAVRAAAQRAPFEALCLAQAIAARMMLARRGVASALHFGAARSAAAASLAEGFDAHAWLDAAGVEVVGYPADAYAEIGCFV